MSRLNVTHTFVEMEVSAATYDEIAARLKEADYGHCFMDDGTIDMHGIGLTKKQVTNPGPADLHRTAWAKDSPVQDESRDDRDPLGR